MEEVTEINLAEVIEVPLMARAVLQLDARFNVDKRHSDWHAAEGNPYMRMIGANVVDPRSVRSVYQTTLVKKVDEDEWCVAEVARQFMELDDPFGRIMEEDIHGQA